MSRLSLCALVGLIGLGLLIATPAATDAQTTATVLVANVASSAGSGLCEKCDRDDFVWGLGGGDLCLPCEPSFGGEESCWTDCNYDQTENCYIPKEATECASSAALLAADANMAPAADFRLASGVVARVNAERAIHYDCNGRAVAIIEGTAGNGRYIALMDREMPSWVRQHQARLQLLLALQ